VSADQHGVTAASEPLTAPVTAPTPPAGDNGNGNANGLVVPKRRHRFVPGDDSSDALELAEIEKAPDSPKPLSKKERKQLGKLRARKVHRTVRHVDPWSVLKLSLVFYTCLFVIVMVAGTILWNLASAAGTIGSVESFFKEIGVLDTFTFQGGTIFRATFLIGLILVIAGAAFNVLLAVLFNLISDLVGGVRFTVIEEETARPLASELVPPRR
jgi:hypothetical protein